MKSVQVYEGDGYSPSKKVTKRKTNKLISDLLSLREKLQYGFSWDETYTKEKQRTIVSNVFPQLSYCLNCLKLRDALDAEDMATTVRKLHQRIPEIKTIDGFNCSPKDQNSSKKSFHPQTIKTEEQLHNLYQQLITGITQLHAIFR